MILPGNIAVRANVLRYFVFEPKWKMRRSEGYAPAYYGGNRSMKWKRAIFWQMAVTVLLFSLAVTGCGTGGSTPSDSQTEYVIRLGHSDTEENLINVSLQHYADYVKENTQGRVVIRLYPNEELGDNTDMAQQLVTGQLDAMMMPQGVEATYAPKIATLGLPFLFTSYRQAWAVVDDAEIAKGLTEGLGDYNMIQLAFWENGMRQITNSVREISTPADVSGLRMRIPDDKMTEAIFRALGARTTVFSWNRTYDALKQGTFDGEENPIANIYANKINEVNQYLTITNHKYETKNLVLMTLPRLWLKDHWLENAMVMFGSWTGSTATGMMLLRIADPELETDAGPNLITATPLWQISTQNFFLTIAPYFIVTAIGFRNLALGTAGMLLAALVLGFVIGRK